MWADRHNRKLLIIGADASIALATATLAILMFFGNRDLWLIYAALAVRSAGAGIQTPAVGALLPQIVPSDRLLSINGINQSIQAGMMLIAPAIAALLYATLPLYWILGVDVVTAAIGIGLMTLIPVAKIVRSEATPTGYFSDLGDGFRYVVTHPLIRWLLGLYARGDGAGRGPVLPDPADGGAQLRRRSVEAHRAGAVVLDWDDAGRCHHRQLGQAVQPDRA